MKATLERTSPDRMTDMYVLRIPGLRKIENRFLCFARQEWEKMYPELVLDQGQKKEIKFSLTNDENGV